MSTSTTSDSNSSETTDARQAVDNGGIAIGAGAGAVTINQVPDEALELGGEVISTLAEVVKQDVGQNRSENAQLLDTVLKFGIPAAAIAFIVSRS